MSTLHIHIHGQDSIYSFSVWILKTLLQGSLYTVVKGVFTPLADKDYFTCTSYVSGVLCFADTSVWYELSLLQLLLEVVS